MAIKKYIRTTEVVKLTGLSYDEILGLAHNGTLDCHKTRRGYWKFKVEDVEKYFGIFTPGNFEVGVFTNNPDFVTSANDLFSMIWDEKCCNNCHRAQKCNEKQ